MNIKTYKILTLLLFFISVISLGLSYSVFKKISADEIDAKTIRIIDESGTARFVLSSNLPNPIVEGKEYPRSTKVAGIQFNDSLGNECGGIGVIDRLEGGLLCFDYKTAEAICISKLEKVGYTGISILDKPPAGSNAGVTGSERLSMNIYQGESKISLSDKNGKERIRIAVDSLNSASIKILDETGNVLYSIP
jgi:hypothetical protein